MQWAANNHNHRHRAVLFGGSASPSLPSSPFFALHFCISLNIPHLSSGTQFSGPLRTGSLIPTRSRRPHQPFLDCGHRRNFKVQLPPSAHTVM